ncbi:MAG TPA: CHAP domain-containing protein [Caldisericia bacterium]|nr:CHAP domain-containing protein [Caldisericia bacterium]HRV75667.1 CHAP domain-containing protein [Caldisericia bacterium]
MKLEKSDIFKGIVCITVIVVLVSILVSNNKPAQPKQPRLSMEYYFDPFTNPFNDDSYMINADGIKYSFFGQGTWYTYGRIQETGAISDINLKITKNRRRNSIGLFYGDSGTWISDAVAAGYKIADYNHIKYGLVHLKKGDICIYDNKTTDMYKTWDFIGCVEKVVNGKVYVTCSNITIRDGIGENPRLPINVDTVIIIDDPENIPMNREIQDYGVYLYSENSDGLISQELARDTSGPLDKGDIFQVLGNRVIENGQMLPDGRTAFKNHYYYKLSGYHKGKWVIGWAELQARNEKAGSETNSLENNFTGIDLKGHEVGYFARDSSFQLSDAKFILLNGEYKIDRPYVVAFKDKDISINGKEYMMSTSILYDELRNRWYVPLMEFTNSIYCCYTYDSAKRIARVEKYEAVPSLNDVDGPFEFDLTENMLKYNDKNFVLQENSDYLLIDECVLVDINILSDVFGCKYNTDVNALSLTLRFDR